MRLVDLVYLIHCWTIRHFDWIVHHIARFPNRCCCLCSLTKLARCWCNPPIRQVMNVMIASWGYQRNWTNISNKRLHWKKKLYVLWPHETWLPFWYLKLQGCGLVKGHPMKNPQTKLPRRSLHISTPSTAMRWTSWFDNYAASWYGTNSTVHMFFLSESSSLSHQKQRWVTHGYYSTIHWWSVKCWQFDRVSARYLFIHPTHWRGLRKINQ